MAWKIKTFIRELVINKRNRIHLTNKNFSVISSNCNGAFILHDLKQPFNSPTVNLYMDAKDYIEFLENIDYYLKCDLIEKTDEKYNYPLGRLDDIVIHFMHYRSFEQAKVKWNERKQRINTQNLFIMMCDRDGCTEEIIRRFDKLSYKNKVIFTHLSYPDIKSAYYIRGFENEKEVGHLFKYKTIFSIHKYYDDFDYVKWFNAESF